MSVHRTVPVWATALACLVFSGTASAQGYSLCVKLEARLVELERGQPRGGQATVHRYNSEIMEQQRMLSVARRQAVRAGCSQQSGFLFFRPPRPTSCAEHDAVIKRLETNIGRLQARRREVMPAYATAGNESERRRLLAMLGDNNCGPQYERYATVPNGRMYGLFQRDYTRDPYMTAPRGPDFYYGTYRTICVRKCDGYFWPISFSTVESHFDDDARLCQASCPTGDVELFVHRNPGEGPQQAISLSGQPISTIPNAFRYRQEVVEDCTCQATVRTASLGQRVVVDLPSRDDSPPSRRSAEGGDAPETATTPTPVPRSRPGNEPPVAGSIATLTGMEDYDAVAAPKASRVAGKDVRIVGPGFTLYRSGGE